MRVFLCLTEYLRKKYRKRRDYIRDGSELIAESNLQTLRMGSLATVSLLSFFLLSTPLIIRGWEATFYHLLFLPVALAMLLPALYLEKRKNVGGRIVTASCLLFETVLFAFLILIDTAGTPEAPATFIPVALIAIPAIFTMPLWASIGIPVICELLYICAVMCLKDPWMRQYDIFGSLFGLFCSMIVSNLIMSLRIRDFENQMKYKKRSTVDALSSILNKQTCVEACEAYLDLSGEDSVFALLILDLDDFKQVNDTRGHIVGDTVIRCTGEVLMDTFRRSDIMGRFGGDEFVVLVRDIDSCSLMARKCEYIQASLQRVTLEETGVQVSCSIGVVIAQRAHRDFRSLLQEADEALYQAKKEGKAGYHIRFDSASAPETGRVKGEEIRKN